MAAKKKQATTAAGNETTTRKFYAGDGNVRIQYPLRTGSVKVQSILDKYPPGPTKLRTVTIALARVGAVFVPWIDGLPGYSRLYFA